MHKNRVQIKVLHVLQSRLNTRAHMFSVFNRSLEVYEEDYVNRIIPY